MKISDRIAYINHDIDDAQRAGVLLKRKFRRKAVKVLGLADRQNQHFGTFFGGKQPRRRAGYGASGAGGL